MTEIEADVADLARAHAGLISHLRSLEPVERSRPSLLPDWTVGHVLTHLARNADSILSMLEGRPQYPGGRNGRAADIDAGAARPWHVLVDDVEHTAIAVDEALAGVDDWSGTVDTITAPRPKEMLPSLRQREVEVHRADLGLGYGFDDFPARYLRKELRTMEMLWRAGRPMGLTPLPDSALHTPPPRRLAWMMGRAEIAGLGPANIW